MGLRDRIRTRLLQVMIDRAPDFIIGGTENPYLLRWWLTPWSGLYRDIPEEERTLWQRFVRALPNAYLHLFLRSDDDRALHDHPWLFNASFLLEGSYIEHVPGHELAGLTADGAPIWRRDTQKSIAILREQGSWYFRWGRAIHRVELLQHVELTPHKEANLIGGGVAKHYSIPCTTLFITGFAVRQWGFWCPKGWVHFKKFTSTEGNVSGIGRGCE